MNSDVEFYASSIGALRTHLSRKKELEKKLKKLNESLYEAQSDLVRHEKAQKLLTAVADENTSKVLSFIEGVVNKVLAEMFPNDPSRIKVQQKIYAGNKPHIVVELHDSEGYVLDIDSQSGDGLKQVVSFLYGICLIEIRKGRKLVIRDECLNGLHKRAKQIIEKIIEIFQKSGYQFIFIEYSFNELGKIYNVEKRGKVAKVVPLVGEYNDDIVFVGKVDLSILDDGEEDSTVA